MSVVSSPMAEYCSSCFFFFKSISSCPRSQVFQKGDPIGISLEIIWVMSSVLPFLVFSALVLHSVIKRTSRELIILLILLSQQIIIAIIKSFIAQPRPSGACSNSYGYPSGHSGFASGLASWLILEAIILHDKVHFKKSFSYTLFRNICLVFAPLIPVSRYFLNYHSIEQIMYGLLTGFVCTIISFGIFTFILARGPVKLWNKLKFYDNYKSHHPQSILDNMKDKIEEHCHRHPFRETVKYFIEKYVIKISYLQEKTEEETEISLN